MNIHLPSLLLLQLKHKFNYIHSYRGEKEKKKYIHIIIILKLKDDFKTKTLWYLTYAFVIVFVFSFFFIFTCDEGNMLFSYSHLYFWSVFASPLCACYADQSKPLSTCRYQFYSSSSSAWKTIESNMPPTLYLNTRNSCVRFSYSTFE